MVKASAKSSLVKLTPSLSKANAKNSAYACRFNASNSGPVSVRVASCAFNASIWFRICCIDREIGAFVVTPVPVEAIPPPGFRLLPPPSPSKSSN